MTTCSESSNKDMPKNERDLAYYKRHKAISQQIRLDENPRKTTLRFWQEGGLHRQVLDNSINL